MIRIRPGASWKEDAEVRRALARAPAEAVAHLVDALAIEVDGVDLASGRAEGELIPALEALVSAVARLVEGATRADVHFSEGGVELLLRRRGASALLTVVALERPSRVLARDVAVELSALAAAARAAGEEFVRDLAVVAPASRDEVARGLRAAVARLAAARPRAPDEATPVPGAPVRSPRRSRDDAPTCGFELHDVDGLLESYRGPGADLGSLLAQGRVFARTGRGEEILSLPCSPFLALRDLASLAGRIATANASVDRVVSQDLAAAGRGRSVAVSVDVARGILEVTGAAPVRVEPLLLARALLEAAIDFCGVAAARNPWQADNPWIAELRASASERLALVKELASGDQRAARPLSARPAGRAALPRAPLGPGRIRRIVFRRAWRTDVGAPAGEALFARGEAVVAAGASAIASFDLASGAERWRAAGADWSAVAAGRILACSGGAVRCIDADSGADRWTRAVDEHDGAPRAAFALRDGPLVLAWPRGLVALDLASGEPLWTFAAPGRSVLHASAFGALALASSEAGLAYGVDALGRIAWRVRLPGPAAAAPRAIGEGALLPASTAIGGVLLLVDPATGGRLWEGPLDFVPSGAVVTFAGLVAASGTIGGDPVIAALDPATGRALWTESAPTPGGAPALASASSSLVAKNAAGTCAAISRDGTVLWSQRRAAPNPPSVNLPPIPARGLVLVPSEAVDVLDPDTGAVVGNARCGAPARLVVRPDLSLVALDSDGLVSGWRVGTHLGVVPSGSRD